jgi:hypothetical protein
MTATSKIAAVIERVSYVIESLTPTLAPSVLFTRHTDTTCRLESVTDPGRLRAFEVRAEQPSYGLLASGAATLNLQRVLRIRVGYPLAHYHPEDPDDLVDGERYLTEDLKGDDFRLIMRAIEGDAAFAALDGDHPVITGATLPLLRGEQDEAGGRVRSVLYGVQIEETYS